MSDNYKWDGELYQGKPDTEKKYDYYKVNEENGENKTASEAAANTVKPEQNMGNRSQGSSGPNAEANPFGAPYQRQYQREERQNENGQRGPVFSGNQVPPFTRPEAKKTKPKKEGNGIGKKFGITISLALVFGLVAGLAFQGVNVISSKYIDTNKSTSQPQLQSTDLVTQSEEAGSKNSSSSTAGSSVTAVAESAMPSVVAITSISVQQVQDFFGRVQEYQGVSSGSGVIVGENEEELLIATNNHVVEDASELTVCFIGDDVVSPEETQEELQTNGGLDTEGAVSATVKGTDPTNDLAVVAVKKEDIPDDTMAQIKIAQIGNSDDLQVGEQVVAIGNALGYGQSVTSGYVSALNRQVTFENNNTATMILTDAAINPGNSGGALLNMQGQLIGINSAKEAADAVEGMGYSIPISTASPILDDLMTRETREKVDESESAYMGIQVADLTSEVTEMYNMPQGAFVAEVTEGSAAEEAGFKQNDIITELDGQKITSRDDLFERLAYYKAGETVEVVVSRANAGEYESQTLTITFDKRPADEE